MRSAKGGNRARGVTGGRELTTSGRLRHRSPREREDRIEAWLKVVLADILDSAVETGLDLENTAGRVARMFVRETFRSYDPEAREELMASMRTFPSTGGDSFIVCGPIPFSSTCAHHLLPFTGNAWVGYIPDALIIGLSKMPRIVRFVSQKLQIQERMTNEVADLLEEVVAPKATAVYVSARHMCMECRGVRVAGAETKTSVVRGLARKSATVKNEFFQLVSLHS